MNVGLIGAHRVGKTTLAREVAADVDWTFVETGLTQVWKDLGMDPGSDLSFSDRMRGQWACLEHCKKVWSDNSVPFITDRTPIDMMGYTLADIQGSTDVDQEEIEEYIAECYQALNFHFGIVCVIQPGLPIIHEPGKAAPNAAYIEHLNFVMRGLMADERVQCKRFYIARRHLDLDYRVNALIRMIENGYDQPIEMVAH